MIRPGMSIISLRTSALMHCKRWSRGGFTSRGRVRTFQEEQNHLAAGIGTFGIGIRSRRTPARPSMTRSVQHPSLKHDTTTVVSVGASGVIDATYRLAPVYDRAEFGLTL